MVQLQRRHRDSRKEGREGRGGGGMLKDAGDRSQAGVVRNGDMFLACVLVQK